MSESSPPDPEAVLAAARAEIDAIDADMISLILRRGAAVEALAAAKDPSESPLRPAREVALMRRLVALAGDKVDADVVVAVWRAMIGDSIRRQRTLEVIVAGGLDPVRHFEIARQHFGPRLRLIREGDVRAALTRVAETPALAAVVPWPGPSGPGMWWPMLTETRMQRVNVVAGLPMRAGEPEAALVASSVRLEQAGEDRTLLVAFDQRFRLQRALVEAGLKGRELARANASVLVEIEGFWAPTDPRRDTLGQAGLDAVRVVGTFARL